MRIHPSAVIHPKAILHESVEVGPNSVIEEDVVIGEGTVVSSCVRIYAGTRIGKNNKFYHGSVIGTDPQDVSYDLSVRTSLEIGDSNLFRESAHISRSTDPNHPMKIGNSNMIMSGVHIGHDTTIGNNCFFVSNGAIAGHVEFGNRVFVSGLVGVHQFVRVGDYAMLGGLTKATKDIPPYCTVEGTPSLVVSINLVGLRRAGFSSETRRAIQEAYRIIYHSKMVTSRAIEELKRVGDPIPEIDYIIRFFESSKRGVADYSYVQ